MAFCRNIILTLLILVVSTSAFGQSQVEVFLDKKSFTITYTGPFRLSQLIDDVSARLSKQELVDINWSLTRLSSPSLQNQLEKQQKVVVEKIEKLSRYWRSVGTAAVADGIQQLAAQVQHWPLTASYYFGIERDRVRLVLGLNPMLGVNKNSRYKLILPSGLPKALEFGLLRSEPIASLDTNWRVAVDGTVIKQPAAYYNKMRPSTCFAHTPERAFTFKPGYTCQLRELSSRDILHTIKLLDSSYLTDSFRDLNEEIMTLAKFISPKIVNKNNE